MKAVLSWNVMLAALLGSSPVASEELDHLGRFDAGDARIVILGEVHDNPIHHDGQAKLVSHLAPPAIVMEMLSAEQARTVNAMGGDATQADLAEALDWADSGWPDFAMYHPILAAAPDARVYGAALPRAQVRAAMSEGAAGVFGTETSLYDLDTPLSDDEQALREHGQAEAHCNALPDDLLPGFVEAQRLRDAHLARVTLNALAETDGPVVVITGNGHARVDWGMPAALDRAAPDVSVISFGQLEAAPDAPPPFDLWRVTAPAEREDPCAAFQ